ncbi:MAG: choice-of-anchor L domain-containing protein [Gelidibacter sp.]
MRNFYIFIVFLFSLSTFSQDIIMQNGTFNRCAPDKFYDSGGGAANYGPNENFVTTICAENPGDFIILNFTSFTTQLNQDILTIYDGPDTSSPVIGSYSGGTTFSPGMVSATTANTSGCLTLQFISNGTVQGAGFIADILCAEPCQTINASIDSTNPLPNGSGVITIFPGASVDFNGSATFSEDNTGATYSWNFADGSPVQAGQSVSHTFNNPGTYNVTFTATDTNPQGCSDTATISVLVLQAIVSINNSAYPESLYTPQELIENVLVSGGCSAVDNFSFQVNGSPTNLQGKNYGYFNKGGAINFPFEEGVVLSTGRAAAGGNIINGNLVSFDNNQGGDADLNLALGQTDTNDAAFIKFNFVPTGDTISFRFLMASEEYDGSTECSFADSFAFLLREVGTTAYTNLAVLPNGVPVSVTNINNSGTCTANPSYFEGYNPPVNETNYGGRTKVLTATANVIMGATYEIKLVVADEGDSIWDSAIFLEAGSFNLGGELGDDITIAAGNAECYGGTVTLDTQAPNATHVWYKDGVEIAGETGSTINVTEAGTYSVDVIFSGTCQANDSIVIEFYPDIAIDSVQDLFLCNPGAAPYNFDLTENNPLILGSITDTSSYVITYHESQSDADSDMNSIANPSTYSGTDGQIIYARLEYQSSGCYDTSSFTINIIDEPTINPVPDLMVCDDVSNDGFEQFDLESQTATILGSQPSANFEVTYYTSFADADAESNPLTSPYVNTINPQPIYVRLESTGTANCTAVSTNPVFNLIVNDRAMANQPDDMFICDDASNDGIGQFNLLTQSSIILGSQLPADYTVTYFESQADAEGNTSPIPNPSTYTNLTNPQTIYVRSFANATPDCYGYTTFNLNVNPLPAVTVPQPLYECDTNSNGLANFNLDEATPELLNGQTGITVSYYISQSDADLGINPLGIPYTNSSNPQTIYVRLEDNTTNCFDTTSLDLIVDPLPMANSPTAIEVCDDNTDGIASFDLTLREAQILNGQTGMSITYHISQSDADSGNNELTSPFTNTIAFFQTIYARVENDASGCFDTVELDLIVNPLPTISTIQDYELCDENNSLDELEFFDLTTKTAEAINGQPNVIVSYHISQADALSDNAALGSPYQNISNPQTIFVRLENTVTGCVNITTFDLVVLPLPSVVSPTPLSVCDDNVSDGSTSIDLGVKDNEITGGNPQYTVSYYLTQADAEAGTSPLPDPYTNTSNPQTVYVRVVDSSTGCHDTTELLLQVEQAPLPNVPSPLEYCDPDSDGFGVFIRPMPRHRSPAARAGPTVSYHETMADAENNVNPLSSPYSNIVSYSQTVYVRVESATIATDCATIVELQLVSTTPPQIEDRHRWRYVTTMPTALRSSTDHKGFEIRRA